jgi:hypothetical protein
VTTGVWTRGIFANEYGMDSSKVTWVVDDEEHVTTLKLPSNVIHAPDGKSLAGMMASGELQAGFTGPAGIGRAGPPTGAWEQGGQKPAEVYPELIPNVAQTEADWFRRTGIYPIHGLITVKTEVLIKYPHVARSLYDAFVEAKKPYIAHLKGTEGDSADEKKYRGLMPLVGDPLPYGLKANMPSIEAMLTYGLQQKLIPARMPLDEVFVDPEKVCPARGNTAWPRSSTSIRTSFRPIPRAIRSILSAARSPPGRATGRRRTRRWLRRWMTPACTRPRSCRPRPPTDTTTLTWPKPSPPIRSASPACFLWTCWRRMPWRR